MLQAVNKDIPQIMYCGPTAIAAVTGLSASKIHKMIRRVRGEYDRKIYGRNVKGGFQTRYDGRARRVAGMSNHMLLEIMRRAGYKPKKVRSENNMTLRQFCDDYGHMGPFIVEVTNHYVTVSHGKILDTLTGYAPVDFKEYKRMKCRVKKWWQF